MLSKTETRLVKIKVGASTILRYPVCLFFLVLWQSNNCSLLLELEWCSHLNGVVSGSCQFIKTVTFATNLNVENDCNPKMTLKFIANNGY